MSMKELDPIVCINQKFIGKELCLNIPINEKILTRKCSNVKPIKDISDSIMILKFDIDGLETVNLFQCKIVLSDEEIVVTKDSLSELGGVVKVTTTNREVSHIEIFCLSGFGSDMDLDILISRKTFVKENMSEIDYINQLLLRSWN